MTLRKQEKSTEFLDVFLDPVKFFTFITGFIPEWYQQDILLDDSKDITIRASRQTGKTEVVAVKILRECLLNPYKVLIIAPTQRQSNLVYGKIEAYLNRHFYFKQLMMRHTRDYTLFDNGSEIYCLPGNSGATVRGYSPDLIVVDEAAYVKDEVFVAIEPSLATTNGRTVLISTPFGKQGRFYDSHARLDHFSKYHVKWNDSSFISKDFVMKEKNSKTEAEFNQEYNAEFIEEADTLFSPDLIKSAFFDVKFIEEAESGWDYYLGVDPARYGLDECTYLVLRHKFLKLKEPTADSSNEEVLQWNEFVDFLDENNEVNLIEMCYWKGNPKNDITDIMGRVQALNRAFDFRKIFMDTSPLGVGAADYLRAENLPIEYNPFGLRDKHDLYANLKLLFEKNRNKQKGVCFRISDFSRLIWQLTEIQYEYSPGGVMKIHHPDKPNAHDDWPDALALAASFMKKPQAIFDF